nr:ribonuclease H-like domain-containing protein [Tanacetum cinerariifolium]
MHDHRDPRFSALKWILRYVRGTLDYGLQLFSSSTTYLVAYSKLDYELQLFSSFTTYLVAYSDADWAGCPTTRRSTSATDGQVRVLHVPSRYQFADFFTKCLPSALFEKFWSSLSIRCPSAPTAREC